MSILVKNAEKQIYTAVEAALKKAGFSILQHRFIDNWHAFAVKK